MNYRIKRVIFNRWSYMTPFRSSMHSGANRKQSEPDSATEPEQVGIAICPDEVTVTNCLLLHLDQGLLEMFPVTGQIFRYACKRSLQANISAPRIA
jgi:hypothetical protein